MKFTIILTRDFRTIRMQICAARVRITLNYVIITSGVSYSFSKLRFVKFIEAALALNKPRRYLGDTLGVLVLGAVILVGDGFGFE